MEELLIFFSVICSSLLFFSVPLVFFLGMRKIRHKELAVLAKHGYA